MVSRLFERDFSAFRIPWDIISSLDVTQSVNDLVQSRIYRRDVFLKLFEKVIHCEHDRIANGTQVTTASRSRWHSDDRGRETLLVAHFQGLVNARRGYRFAEFASVLDSMRGSFQEEQVSALRGEIFTTQLHPGDVTCWIEGRIGENPGEHRTHSFTGSGVWSFINAPLSLSGVE